MIPILMEEMKERYAYVTRDVFDALRIGEIFDTNKFTYSEHDDIREIPSDK